VATTGWDTKNALSVMSLSIALAAGALAATTSCAQSHYLINPEGSFLTHSTFTIIEKRSSSAD
jgi:hypothetical protein